MTKIHQRIVDIQQATAAFAMSDEGDFESIQEALGHREGLEDNLLAVEEVIAEYDAMAAAAEERIKALQERKGRFKKSAETLRAVILQAMDMNDIQKINGPAATLSLRKTKAKIEVVDEALIPSRFFAPQPPKVDKKALSEAVLEDGEVIEGVEMVEAGISLSIRRV